MANWKKRIEKAHETDKIFVALQMATDAAVIAAAEVFGMGPVRCARFVAKIAEVLNEISSAINADSVEDPAFVYTKERIDRRLREICGEENFQMWDVRYGKGKI